MSELINIENLSKSYGKKKALDNINLKINKGKVIGILGENGAGKTTLIKLIAGLSRKDSGNIKINNIDIGFDTHKYISYMPDKFKFYDWMKVQDAIENYQVLFDDFDNIKAEFLCNKLKLNKNDLIKSLSTGMKERVMIMLTFSRSASIYLLDEPIGGIDPVAKDMILKTILSVTNDISSIILSTHLIKDIEKILDEVIFIKEGKIKVSTSSDKIREEYNKSIEEYYLEVMQND